jgi:SAM-dependent methyltransferase
MIPLQRHYPLHLHPGGEGLVKKMISALPARVRSEESSLLLAGCGYGEAGFHAEKYFPGSLIAVDEDSEGIFYAKMVAGQRPKTRVSFRTMPPLALRFDDASFDVVFLNGILNVYPKSKLLKEARRILKDDGVLAIADSYWLSDEVPGFAREAWEGLRNRVFTRTGLEELLNRCAFHLQTAEDRSGELRSFYLQFKDEAKAMTQGGFEGRKHLKSLIKRYKHEIDVYTKLGGHKVMGYILLTAAKDLSQASPATESDGEN